MRIIVMCALLAFVPLRAIAMKLIMLLCGVRPQRDPADPHFDVVCFSHVPWRHIWQRNHHTMTRLAANRKVLYLQLPGIAYIHVFSMGFPATLPDLQARHDSVETRLPLLIPAESKSPLIRALNKFILTAYVQWHEWRLGMRNTVLWFYYPGSAYVTEALKPTAVVYDIQDEYTAFTWSPKDIAAREQDLLGKTDVIFAGTHALFQTKTRGFGGASHFYPCAVEFDHFHAAAPGSSTRQTEPPEIRNLQRPRLIYVGLIDGRIDAELLLHMAKARPDWEIVMVGPVDGARFDAERVASIPNIHFLGKIEYARLPDFLAHSDVYLMPWQVNELTRHINPTKTLEYFAAGRPVVSVALPDLEEFFASSVALARTHEEFVAHCDAALAGKLAAQVEEGLKLARAYAWETVIAEMESHVREAMNRRAAATATV